MPIKVTNNITMARRIVKRSIPQAQNAGANAHANFSSFMAPKDTGFMSENITQTEEATEEKPQAAVTSAAPYSEAVEFGYTHHKSGNQIPAQPFFIPGQELGRQRVMEEGYRATAELRRGSRAA